MSISQSLARRIPSGLKPLLRIVLRMYMWIYGKITLKSPLKSFKVAKFKKYSPLKLNVGCGKAKVLGWVNIDIEPGADLVMDVGKGVPFDDGSVDFIYNEHFLEHFTFEAGESILMEFSRCLKKGGVLRIAVPDLEYIIQKYNTAWKGQEWLSSPEYTFIKTRGRMINVAFRAWGHKYIYDEECLRNQLIEAGFQKIERCNWNESNHVELTGLETRIDSKLIMEAIKE